MNDSTKSPKAPDERTQSQRLKDADSKASQARSLIWFLKGFGGPGAEHADVEDLSGYIMEYCDVALTLMWDSYEDLWPVMQELKDREEAGQEAATEGQP